jgi:ABC-type multidrug transport system ATPase subunit
VTYASLIGNTLTLSFCCQEYVELTNLRDALVGTDDSFGLSFEQKKRLSVAVELAASPSVLFLDEVSRVSRGAGACLLVALTAERET